MPEPIVTAPNASKDSAVAPGEAIGSDIFSRAAARAAAQVYDTVTSVHDIEQDDHHYYGGSVPPLLPPPPAPSSGTFERAKLGKIVEVPSKNITRNNSMSDLDTKV